MYTSTKAKFLHVRAYDSSDADSENVQQAPSDDDSMLYM